MQTATPEELVKQLNQRWDAVKNLTATVEIYATETKTGEGITKDFPSCRGIIIMRKPKMLRVRGTYFGVMIFDMASDGNHFTLVIPSKNMAIEGANSVTEQSRTRSKTFAPTFSWMRSQCGAWTLKTNTWWPAIPRRCEDAANKHLYSEPEYVLSIMHHKSGQELLPTPHHHVPSR